MLFKIDLFVKIGQQWITIWLNLDKAKSISKSIFSHILWNSNIEKFWNFPSQLFILIDNFPLSHVAYMNSANVPVQLKIGSFRINDWVKNSYFKSFGTFCLKVSSYYFRQTANCFIIRNWYNSYSIILFALMVLVWKSSLTRFI